MRVGVGIGATGADVAVGRGVGTWAGTGDGVAAERVGGACFVGVVMLLIAVTCEVLGVFAAVGDDGVVVVVALLASAQVHRVRTSSSVRHPSPHCVLRRACRNRCQRR